MSLWQRLKNLWWLSGRVYNKTVPPEITLPKTPRKPVKKPAKIVENDFLDTFGV